MTTFDIPAECLGSWYAGRSGSPVRRIAPGTSASLDEGERLSWWPAPEVTGAALRAGLEAAPMLEIVTLDGTKLDLDGATALARAPKLRDLALERLELTGASCEALTSSTSITMLRLREVALTDALVASLCALPLRSFWLHTPGPEVTDASIAHVASVSTLDFLGVTLAPSVRGTTLAALREREVPSTIMLDWLDGFDPRSLAGLSGHAKLEQLWLLSLRKVGDEACALAATLPALRSLQLRGCGRVTDVGLALLHAHPSLTAIEVPKSKDSKKVTKGGVAALAAARPGCNVYRS